ncbi:MAG: alpha-glucosidase C-terminal domain-containing protein [Saprospiraceae bacterium]|nr:alpha-glucosidase C-terminal domain-containing protein [Saprospiraceae bacterium]
MRIFIHSILLSLLACAVSSCQHQTPPAVPPSSNTAAPAPAGTPQQPDWAPHSVLYECNIRQFSQEGNFQGVLQQLPRLKELGVDVLWLMPVHPIGKLRRKGSLGSPYSVQDYYAINPDFGTLDELKNLVRATHALNMKLILDWVPNHTSWDAVWKQEHPEYYTRYNGDFTVPLNEHGEPIADWADICDLDYNNPDLRDAMIKAMQYWIRECDIDGYRVDMAGLVPNDFWAQARPALDSVKPVFMLSEWQDEPGHFKSCFNVNYGWKWKDITKDIWAGKQTAQSLDTLLNYLNEVYPKGYAQLYFTQNHDENSWSGTESELYGASADAFNVLAFTWQGMPMIYSGQEDALVKRLEFFEKDPIRWKKYAKQDFFSRLCTLKHINKAIWAGQAGGNLEKIPTNAENQVYAFTREKDGDRVIVVLNLSKDRTTVTLRPGERLAGPYADVFGRSTLQVTKEMTLNMKPWEYQVYSSK